MPKKNSLLVRDISQERAKGKERETGREREWDAIEKRIRIAKIQSGSCSKVYCHGAKKK